VVSVLPSSMVDRGFEPPGEVKPKTIKLVFVASPLSTQYYRDRAKTGWLGIRIMCWSDISTCGLVSVSNKDPTQHVDLVQSRLHHHLIEN
jgi:hypothetical protein